MCYVDTKAVGKKIKELREQRGLTQEQLAELLNVSNTYIAMIETGKRQGKFILGKIAKVFEVDVDVVIGDTPLPGYVMKIPRPKPFKSLMREAEERFEALGMRELPILCHVPCGYPMPNEQQAEGYLKVFKDDLGYAKDRPDLFVLIASGECLSGDNIHDGYYLIVDPEPAGYPESLIYAVRIISDSEVTCKHVYHKNGKVILKSSNPSYKDLIYNADDVEIKGLVILSGTWNKQYK